MGGQLKGTGFLSGVIKIFHRFFFNYYYYCCCLAML